MMKPHPARILIVDDEPDLTRTLARALTRLLPKDRDFRIETAASPDEALDVLARSTDADALLVVSDFNLCASRNGVELLEEVARRHGGARRVLMSGYSFDDLAPHLEGKRLDAVLAKPLNLREFSDLALTLVDGPAA